jgi:hypothetical protein
MKEGPLGYVKEQRNSHDFDFIGKKRANNGKKARKLMP